MGTTNLTAGDLEQVTAAVQAQILRGPGHRLMVRRPGGYGAAENADAGQLVDLPVWPANLIEKGYLAAIPASTPTSECPSCGAAHSWPAVVIATKTLRRLRLDAHTAQRASGLK